MFKCQMSVWLNICRSAPPEFLRSFFYLTCCNSRLLLFSQMLVMFWLLFCNVDDVYNVLALLFRSATPHSWIPPTSYQLNGYWVLGSFGQKIHPNNISVFLSLQQSSDFCNFLKFLFLEDFGLANPGSAIHLEYARVVSWMPNASEGRRRCEFLQFQPVLSNTKAFPPNKKLADLNTNWSF